MQSADYHGVPKGEFAPTFMADLPLARAAFAYARELHRGQRRDSDQAPFILHPLEVACLLHNTGHAEPVVAAAILHDTVEVTPAGLQEIQDRFGPEVAELVAAVTEDPQIEEITERKQALRRRLVMLDEVTPEHPLVRQLRFELEALEGLAPRLQSLWAHLGSARLYSARGGRMPPPP